MEQYRIKGGNGFCRELFCNRAEAITAWKRIGGNTKLFVIKDGHEFTVLVNNNKQPDNFKVNPFAEKQFNALFKPEEPKAEEPLPPPEEEFLEPTINAHSRPIRSWFAYPTY